MLADVILSLGVRMANVASPASVSRAPGATAKAGKQDDWVPGFGRGPMGESVGTPPTDQSLPKCETSQVAVRALDASRQQ